MVYFGKKQGGGSVPANAATKDGNNVFTGTNTFNAASTFNETVNVLKDKVIQMGWQADTPKLKIGGANGNNDGFIVAPSGDLRINEGGHGRINVYTDITMNNHWIGNLHDPSSAQDAATKNYVDNKANQVIGQSVQTLSGAQWKNVINSKIKVYGWTTNLSDDIKNNIVGIELFHNGTFQENGSNLYGLSYTRYSNELKVSIWRLDGQNIVETDIDPQQIKIRYARNIG